MLNHELAEFGTCINSRDALQIFSIFFTLLAAIAASFSAHAARKSAHASHEANRAKLFMDFSNRYNSEEMLSSLVLLTDYYKRNRSDFLKRWAADRENRDPEVKELDAALRNVGRYYLDIARLYDQNLVSEKMAHAMCAQRGINVFYKIWLPMSKTAKPKLVSEDRCVSVHRKIRKQYDTGEII